MSCYDLVITSAKVVLPGGVEAAGRRGAWASSPIAAVGPGLADQSRWPSSTGSGKWLIPGGVDVHVHLELPFCGTTSSDDWESGTRAAARGGVTTVIDFAIPYGQESLEDAFNNWSAKAGPKACVDYCFHLAITDWDRHGPEMAGMVAKG